MWAPAFAVSTLGLRASSLWAREVFGDAKSVSDHLSGPGRDIFLPSGLLHWIFLSLSSGHWILAAAKGRRFDWHLLLPPLVSRSLSGTWLEGLAPLVRFKPKARTEFRKAFSPRSYW